MKKPQEQKPLTLRDLVKNQSALAREVGVSPQLVAKWVKQNSLPPKHAIKVALALDMHVPDIYQFTKKGLTPGKSLRKSEEDLDTLLAAYEGRPYETELPERSIKAALVRWGDRLPLMVQTLKGLKEKTTTLDEAAQRLGVAKHTVVNLRLRYGLGPGLMKPVKGKVEGRYKKLKKEAPSLVLDVIAGRKTARAAAEQSSMSLRTLHRHLEAALRPQMVNEISHWSRNFRSALAWEIERGTDRHSVQWRQWADEQQLVLPKVQKKIPPVSDWRKASVRRMLIAVLTDEVDLTALAAARGGEEAVILALLEGELRQMGMNPLSLSVHHQAAVAEIVAARESLFRKGVRERD